MNKQNIILEQIEKAGVEKHFVGKLNIKQINDIENELNVKLPESFFNELL